MTPSAPTSIRLDPALRKRLVPLLRLQGATLGSLIDEGLRELLARTCPTCGSLRPSRPWRRYFRDAQEVKAWADRHGNEAAYVVVDYGNGPRAFKGRVTGLSDGHRIELHALLPTWTKGSMILLSEYVVDALSGVPHAVDVADFEQRHPGIPVDEWGRR